MKKYEITEKEYKEIKKEIKKNRLKKVDKRLQVLVLRYEGYTRIEIAEKLGYSVRRISQLCNEFKKEGIKEFTRHKYGGNRQAIPKEKEKELLEGYRKKAEEGQIITVREIKKTFDEYRKKESGRGYIYMLLDRHNWRMVMPRGKHPKKASDEDIEASKKLTKNTENY